MTSKKRVVVYSIFFVIFLGAIFYKINVIVGKQKSEVVSQISEWQKNGKPVELEEIRAGKFYNYTKVSSQAITQNVLESYVSSTLAEHIKPGQPFYLNNEADGLNGVVSFASARMDLATGLYQISLKLSGKQVKTDTVYPTFIKTTQVENAISIPNDSIIVENDKAYVWVVDNKRAVKRELNIKLDNGQRSLITSGVKSGEQVVVAGKTAIFEGDLLNIISCNGCR